MTMRDMEKVYDWRKKNQKRIEFYVNLATEEDVFNKLNSVENKRQYLIDLIRKDIENERR